MSKQRADGTSTIKGVLDPIARARFDAMLAAWAAAGMNNPSDPDSPSGAPGPESGSALADAAECDGRTQSQRNHDGFSAFLADGLDSGRAGSSHRGLPVQVNIKVDEADLRRRAGLGTTASGTVIPMSDVVELAARADWHLAVFAQHSTIPLYLGTAKRCASRGQRLALFAAPGGEMCCAPGCDQPATHLEIHHAKLDFALGGRTDITELKGTCPRHNRMVGAKLGQFTTSIIDTGQAMWRRNTAPGQPPDPGRINLVPDVGRLFSDKLSRVNMAIRRPPKGQPRSDPWSHPPQYLAMSTIRAAGLSVAEVSLAARLNTHASAAA